MELPDETGEYFEANRLPERVRAALAENWNDNESENANFDLISRWLRIAGVHPEIAVTPSELS